MPHELKGGGTHACTYIDAFMHTPSRTVMQCICTHTHRDTEYLDCQKGADQEVRGNSLQAVGRSVPRFCGLGIPPRSAQSCMAGACRACGLPAQDSALPNGYNRDSKARQQGNSSAGRHKCRYTHPSKSKQEAIFCVLSCHKLAKGALCENAQKWNCNHVATIRYSDPC